MSGSKLISLVIFTVEIPKFALISMIRGFDSAR